MEGGSHSFRRLKKREPDDQALDRSPVSEFDDKFLRHTAPVSIIIKHLQQAISRTYACNANRATFKNANNPCPTRGLSRNAKFVRDAREGFGEGAQGFEGLE